MVLHREGLGRLGEGHFKALGEGGVAKKGQGKEKAKMFTEKRSQWKK